MSNYLTKSYEIRAYTLMGEFLCVECGESLFRNSDDDPQPVFNDQWNTQEMLETYGLEIPCFACYEEIRQPKT